MHVRSNFVKSIINEAIVHVNKKIGHAIKKIGHVNRAIQYEELEYNNETTMSADKNKTSSAYDIKGYEKTSSTSEKKEK